MTKDRIVLDSLAQTQMLGRMLGEIALEGDVYCLDGDLGAGKTTLTQAIATGLEVSKKYYITSPSFNIFHQYPGRIPLYHMDFYRLNSEQDIIDMGLDEYFYLSGLTVIEWAKRAAEILPKNSLYLGIQIHNAEDRVVTMQYTARHWQQRIRLLMQKFLEAN